MTYTPTETDQQTPPAVLAPNSKLLYSPAHEHDACGVGFLADIGGHRSHRILELALESVTNLTHRGAVDADAKSGDGAGILTQIPHRLFRAELERRGLRLERPDDLAVGMFFLPQDEALRERARGLIADTVARHGFRLLGWRVAPIDSGVLGDKAAQTQPDIQQIMLGRPDDLPFDQYESSLFLLRKEIEHRAAQAGVPDFYVPSLSHRTLVYKGLLVAPQLKRFYLDLQHPLYETALAVFHQRYSTNTFPSWQLAQPFRMLAHNGEINTVQGNRNWMRAREPEIDTSVWREWGEAIRPLVWARGSDSASLDNVLEALTLAGRDVRHAMMMLVPEAWENMPGMGPEVRAFYEYSACLIEPWDGPAALAFSDGVWVGAALDRNGLRPARYKITDDNLIAMASEVGVIDLPDEHVVEKGRLGPGQMIAVDTARGRLLRNDEIKAEIAHGQPYRLWLDRHLLRLGEHMTALDGEPMPLDPAEVPLQKAFGYTSEEIQFLLRPMVAQGKEPVGSMGDDTPLAVLSQKPRLLYNFFKQKFAQVTNPPIDPLREELVMSLNTMLGRRRSLFDPGEEHAHLVQLDSPILLDNQLKALRRLGPLDPALRSATLECRFRAAEGPEALALALDALCRAAEAAVDEGAALLILSDRGIDAEWAPVPMLLAVGAVHHALIRAGKRMRASIVVETGEAWEVHHFALLIGYGASAINPYLALRSIRNLVAEERAEAERRALRERQTARASDKDAAPLPDLPQAIENYESAAGRGLLKIMSKMGISAIASYQGAQIFEAVGLDNSVVERCFAGTDSRIGGLTLAQIGEDVLLRHAQVFDEGASAKLADYGFYRYRKDGEYHGYSPQLVRVLHKAVETGKYDDYAAFRQMAEEHAPAALRHLLAFRPDRQPIPIDEVEPIEAIVKRFEVTAMSIGALSPEAHETLSRAMNQLGGRANTGEGGEQTWRYRTEANSKVKQVASGRFGVTPEYLAFAEELQIKMAQGSKPGEGGQLPGHKVVPHIAEIRHTVPGITLISPPPHHDIYSIEDLAQLIYDLKVVNPRARVSVKLVSEAGVGTIAAGVAKAYADAILISGHDGGTGASPWSSIKNAGVPWELGLSETQQVLVLNNLRGRVSLRTDGGLRTGRDVIIAALLGAEEYGFGTAAAVAIGCQMARQCHLNTCPVGVATQRADLRAKFFGTVEMAKRYFLGVAQDVREHLARFGYRSLDELIGRTDLLEQVPIEGLARANTLDLSRVLGNPDPGGERPRRRQQERNDREGDVVLDDRILRDVAPSLAGRGICRRQYKIRNTNRTVGARVAGEIARRYGNAGLPEGSLIELTFSGSAGQSFGAFGIHGLRLTLIGEANDYVAKGMNGGEVVVRPPGGAGFSSRHNAIVGNTVLYGATGGHLFVAGRAGERYAVRNSGSTSVVEGVGDHACEYMTAGTVVVLGETGRNFGAGMSGGVAYVLDEAGDFPSKFNPELVGLRRLTPGSSDAATLRALIARHTELTDSAHADALLANWRETLSRFWQVEPHPSENRMEHNAGHEDEVAEDAALAKAN